MIKPNTSNGTNGGARGQLFLGGESTDKQD